MLWDYVTDVNLGPYSRVRRHKSNDHTNDSNEDKNEDARLGRNRVDLTDSLSAETVTSNILIQSFLHIE